MSNLMNYKNYYGSVEYSAEDEVFFGKIEFINDLVTFEATSVDELKKAFKESVEHYLRKCKEYNKEPQKAFKGRFNVRIKPELHKKASFVALKRQISLDKLVELAISSEIGKKESYY
ncbi:type II toxin-antitoxin system HicB family antitoxin [Desulfobacterales bacterium HSG2]|nr:type II toxin-antitoxin system HicB family antitoxin [Desulfobacterales bacterium HSG2]